jgi:succinate dehydrogenase (ubiquinone) membrane anchor subunit
MQELNISRNSITDCFYRAVSVALVPLTAIPFAAGSALPLVDAGLISMLILHTYMGFQ